MITGALQAGLLLLKRMQSLAAPAYAGSRPVPNPCAHAPQTSALLVCGPSEG